MDARTAHALGVALGAWTRESHPEDLPAENAEVVIGMDTREMVARFDASALGADRERDRVGSVARCVGKLDHDAHRWGVTFQGNRFGVLQRFVEFLEPLGREKIRHVLGSGLHVGFGGRLLGASANRSP